jgi:hypothetical protein
MPWVRFEVMVKCLIPGFVSLSPPERRDLSQTNCAHRPPEPSKAPRLLLPLRHEVGAGVRGYRLISEGVPISNN